MSCYPTVKVYRKLGSQRPLPASSGFVSVYFKANTELNFELGSQVRSWCDSDFYAHLSN